MPYKIVEPIVRFKAKIEVTDNGCWKWLGYINPSGYGYFSVRHKLIYAHRWSYEYFVGEIPEGYQIDHLCLNKHCVNPEHLEAVTQSENTIRAHQIPGRKPWGSNVVLHRM